MKITVISLGDEITKQEVNKDPTTFEIEESNLDLFFKHLEGFQNQDKILIKIEDLDENVLKKIINKINDEGLVQHIEIDSSEDKIKNYNKLLYDIYLKNKRNNNKEKLKENKDLESFSTDTGLIKRESVIDFNKVRRAKIKGSDFKPDIGYSHQQQQEQEQEEEQQQETQTSQQQMSELLKALEQLKKVEDKDIELSDEESIGHLINKSNLHELNNAFSQIEHGNHETLETIWDSLVGENADKIKNIRRKVTDVEIEAMEKILQHFREFGFGLNLDNLPVGFYLKQTETKNILCYKEEFINVETYTPLTIYLNGPEEKVDIGSCLQFYSGKIYDESGEFTNEYKEFLKQYENKFQNVFKYHKKKKQELNIKDRLNQLLDFIEIDNSDLKEPISQYLSYFEFNHNNIDGLSKTLLTSGSEGVLIFLGKLKKLEDAGLYEHFKNVFLDTNNDYSELINDKTLAFVDQLCALPSNEKTWWKSLTEQHIEQVKKADFHDLFNAFNYFKEKIKNEHGLILPSTFPFTDIKNMKVCLDRLLFIIDHSLYKEDQLYHLDNLDMTPEGSYYAMRYQGFLSTNQSMNITPTNVLKKKIKEYTKFPNEIEISADFGRVGISARSKNNLGFVVDDDYSFMGFMSVGKTLEKVEEKNEKIYSLLKTQDQFKDCDDIIIYKFKTKKSGKEEAFPFWPGDDNKGFLVIGVKNNRTEFNYNFDFVVSDKNEEFCMIMDGWGGHGHNEILDDISDELFLNQEYLNYRLEEDDDVRERYSEIKGLITGELKTKSIGNLIILFNRYVGLQKYQLKSDIYKSIIIPKLRSMDEKDSISRALVTIVAHATTNKRSHLITDNKKSLDNLINFIVSYYQYKDEKGILQEDKEKKDIMMNILNQTMSGYKASINIDDIFNVIKFATYFEDKGYSFVSTLFSLPREFQRSASISEDEDIYLDDNIQNMLINLNKRLEKADGDNQAKTKALFGKWNENLNIEFQNALGTFYLECNNITPEMREYLTIYSVMDLTEGISIKDIHSEVSKIQDDQLRKELIRTLVNIDVVSSKKLPKKDDLKKITKEIVENKNLKTTDIVNLVQIHLPETDLGGLKGSEVLNEIYQTIREYINSYDIDSYLKEAKTNYGRIFSGIEFALKTLKGIKINDVLEKLKSKDEKIFIEGLNIVLKLLGDGSLDSILKKFVGDDFKKTIQDTFTTQFSNQIKSKLDLIFGKDMNDEILSFSNYILDEKLGTIEFNRGIENQLKQFSENFAIISKLLLQIENIRDKKYTHQIENLGYEDVNQIVKFYMVHKDVLSLELFNDFLFILNQHDGITVSENLNILKECGIFTKEQLKDKQILSSIQYLIENQKFFTEEQFKHLLKISINYYKTYNKEFPLKKIILFSKLSQTNKQISSNDSKMFFNTVIETISNVQYKEDDIQAFVHNTISMTDKISNKDLAFFKFLTKILETNNQMSKDDPSIIKQYNQLLGELLKLKSESILLNYLAIIKSATLDSNIEFSFEESIELIKQLNQSPEQLNKIVNLYKYKPCPRLSIVIEELKKGTLENYINQFELDPTGSRHLNNKEKYEHQIAEQFSTEKVKSAITLIKRLDTENSIPIKEQINLAKQFTYINSIGHSHKLNINGKNKSLKDFTREELQTFIRNSVKNIQDTNLSSDLREKARLEYLAAIRESMYRSTGKFPYSTQVISALNILQSGENLLAQINTGEGKSIVTALLASLLWAEGQSVDVCSANFDLASRDYSDFKDFYDYIGIKTNIISASSAQGSYIVGGINYSDVPNMSLYRSRAKLVGEKLRGKGKQKIPVSIVGDEFDHPALDEKTKFNFSVVLDPRSNPYKNIHEWIYPLINQFVDSKDFQRTNPKQGKVWTREQDIVELKRFLNENANLIQKKQLNEISDDKLDRWINAACVAMHMKLDKDFIISEEERDIDGKGQKVKVPVARILINDIAQPGAKWSDGVHQFVHARLEKNRDKINHRNSFPCDAELSFVASQAPKGFLSYYLFKGRIVGITGTGGSKLELKEQRTKYKVKPIDIPPHKESQRKAYQEKFVEKRDKDLISKKHLREIEKSIKESQTKRDNQPILLLCENFEKADYLYTQLKKYEDQGYTIQLGPRDVDKDKLKEIIKKAGNEKTITIGTRSLLRGVDVQTKHRFGLFVIISFFDRFRTLKQAIGRTARNGQLGQFQAIYETKDIENKYYVNLNKYRNYKTKVEQLEKLHERMDKEAAIERHYVEKVDDLKEVLLKHYDKWIKFARDNESPDIRALKNVLLAEKETIISFIESEWKQLLEDSDPNKQYKNPYVRYDSKGNLNTIILDQCYEDFKTKLFNKWKEKQSHIIKLINDKDNEVSIPLPLKEFDLQHEIERVKLKITPSSEISISEMTEMSDALNPDKVYLSYNKEQTKETLLTQRNSERNDIINHLNLITEKIHIKNQNELEKTVKLIKDQIETIKTFDLNQDKDYFSLLDTTYTLLCELTAKKDIKDNLLNEIIFQPLIYTLNTCILREEKSEIWKRNTLFSDIQNMNDQFVNQQANKIINDIKNSLKWVQNKESIHYKLSRKSVKNALEELTDFMNKTDENKKIEDLYKILLKHKERLKGKTIFSIGHKNPYTVIKSAIRNINELKYIDSKSEVSFIESKQEIKSKEKFSFHLGIFQKYSRNKGKRLEKNKTLSEEYKEIQDRIDFANQQYSESGDLNALYEVHEFLLSKREKLYEQRRFASDLTKYVNSLIHHLELKANRYKNVGKAIHNPMLDETFNRLSEQIHHSSDEIAAVKIEQTDQTTINKYDLVLELKPTDQNTIPVGVLENFQFLDSKENASKINEQLNKINKEINEKNNSLMSKQEKLNDITNKIQKINPFMQKESLFQFFEKDTNAQVILNLFSQETQEAIDRAIKSRQQPKKDEKKEEKVAQSTTRKMFSYLNPLSYLQSKPKKEEEPLAKKSELKSNEHDLYSLITKEKKNYEQKKQNIEKEVNSLKNDLQTSKQMRDKILNKNLIYKQSFKTLSDISNLISKTAELKK